MPYQNFDSEHENTAACDNCSEPLDKIQNIEPVKKNEKSLLKRFILIVLIVIIAGVIIKIINIAQSNNFLSETDNPDLYNDYYGTYYSPTELYEITLYKSEHEVTEDHKNPIYVEIKYINGAYDSGVVIANEETTLLYNSTITIKLNKNGKVHIELYSGIAANGDFDEYLEKGSLLDKIGLISAGQLNHLTEDELFKYLCELEHNSTSVAIKDLINHPNQFCDDVIYRIPGKVTWAEGNKFILQITNDYENDSIVCYSSEFVSEGEEVCVYGKGIGEDEYTRTYYEDVPSDYSFKTLGFDVGFILRKDHCVYDNEIPDHLKEFIFDEYDVQLQYGNPNNMERTLIIDSKTINGRPYTIQKSSLTFAYASVYNNLDGIVKAKLVVSTTNKYDQKVDLTLSFELKGIECNYILVKDGYNTSYEIAYYSR